MSHEYYRMCRCSRNECYHLVYPDSIAIGQPDGSQNTRRSGHYYRKL